MPEYVTGYSVRAPNANNVQEFYEALRDKKDLTGASRRYPENYLNLPPRAGTLPEIDRFDNEFFKFNIKQTDKMDIVIRLMLEVTQEALMDAKISIPSLRGSRTGVYVGHCFSDYLNRQSGSDIDKTGYELVNGANSMAANKISYFYDLRGPSMVFDTACSSSLVALHQAQKDLQAGIIDRAIIGGASLTLDPHKNQIFGAYSMLSPDGRCYSFDSRANGYCRSEGIAVVVIESSRVSQYGVAVLSGSSVNSDGFTSKGITFPSGEAQAENAKSAFVSSGVDVSEVGYVEAHGTGTIAGDAQELNGLLRSLYSTTASAAAAAVAFNGGGCGTGIVGEDAVPVSSATAKVGVSSVAVPALGGGDEASVGEKKNNNVSTWLDVAGDSDITIPVGVGGVSVVEELLMAPRNIPIGSVKSVMGHAEGASGLMSVIKVLLMYEHKVLLPNQNYESTHHSALLDGYFDVVTNLTPWPQPTASCISNYGFGGTNAFAILQPGNVEQAPVSVSATDDDGTGWVPTFGSTVTGAADSERFKKWFREQVQLGNDSLYSFRCDQKKLSLNSSSGYKKIAFVFSGQGSQWSGMGRTLMETSSVFRNTIIRLDHFARVVDPEIRLYDWFIAATEDDEVEQVEEKVRKQQVGAASATDTGWMRKERSGLGITAYQVALVNMLRDPVVGPGVQGDFFLGHSLGEVGAGYAAGLQSEQQTIEIAIVRGSLTHKIRPNMYVLKTSHALPREQIEQQEQQYPGNVTHFLEMGEAEGSGDQQHGRRSHYYYVKDLSLLDISNSISNSNCSSGNVGVDLQIFDLTGSMVAVGLPPSVIAEGIEALGLKQTCIACFNSPAGQTVSGAAAEVVQLKQYLVQRHDNLFWRDIPTDQVAYHAPHLMCHYDYLVMQFARILGTSVHKELPPAFICTSVDPATVAASSAVLMDAHFHARNIVQPVYFQQAVERLPAGGETLIVEIGPHQGLLGQLKRVRSDVGLLGLVKMGSDQSELRVATALPTLLWAAGYTCHREQVSSSISRAHRLPLPQRLPCLWNHGRKQMIFDYTDFEMRGGGSGSNSSSGGGGTLTAGGVEIVYDLKGEHSFLLDHVVQGQSLFPATGHLFTFWSAVGLDKAVNISDFEITQAVPLDPAAEATLTFRVFQTGSDVWIMKDGMVAARAVVVSIPPQQQDPTAFPSIPATAPIDEVAAARSNEVLDGNSLYNHFKRFGYEYSTSFRLVKYRSIPTTNAVNRVTTNGEYDGFAVLNPAVHVIAWLDAMLQLFLEDLSLLRLPTLLRKVRLRPELFISSSTAVAAAPNAHTVFIDKSTRRVVSEFAMFQGLHTLPANKARHPARLVHATQTFVHMGLHMLDDGATFAEIEQAAGWMAGQLTSHLAAHPEEIESKPWLQNVLRHATSRLATITLATQQLVLTPSSSDLLDNPLGAMAYHTYADMPAMLANPLRCISLAPEHGIFYSRTDNQAFVTPMDVLEKCVQLVAQEWYGCGLCVLEGGIGTGGLTRRLWPLLSPYLEQYVGLDVSAIVPGEVIERDVRFSTLHHNLNEPLPSAASKYHLFCASNAIHVTHDIANTLCNLCASLHDGGYLLLEEFVESDFCLYLWGLDASIWSMPNPAVPRSFGLWMSWEEWVAVIAQVPELEIILAYRTQVRLTLLLRRRSTELKTLWCHGVETKTDWRDIDATNTTTPHRYASKGALAFFRTALKEYSNCTLHTATLDAEDANSLSLVQSNPLLRHVAVYEGMLGAWLTTTYPPTCTSGTVVPASIGPKQHFPSTPTTLALSIQRPGDLATLSWCPKTLPAATVVADSAGPVGETKCVIVDVEFAGLNFKDVMYAFGKLRLDTPSFGLEVAGRCSAVLSNAVAGERERPEREVIGIGRTHCIATRTRLDMVWDVPAGMTLAEAATVPVVYLTALFAMFEKARLEAGQSLLVHGGAGGVGHAAIHLASCHGIEVFTTCSEHKRAHMKQWFGLDDAHIGNSRDLTFVEMVLAGTQGEGVDAVLNCLSGPALSASLTLVKPFGHFCEIGKFDLQTNTHIGLKVFECNVSYHAIDLAAMFTHKHYSKVLQRLLQSALDSGHVRALPFEVFSSSKVADGLRYLSAGKHVGKVLINMIDAHEIEQLLLLEARPGVTSPPLPSCSCSIVSTSAGSEPTTTTDAAVAVPPPSVRFLTSGTHIVTGGLGGFGMELAHWLADCGAERIVLTSRTGLLRTGWQRVRFEALQQHPNVTECTISTADVGVREQCSGLITAHKAGLRGIWHAAMVLEDMTFVKQTEEAWKNVHFAKSTGATHLDVLSRELLLEGPGQLHAFVVFSSIVALHGNIGQAAYAHANAECEWVVQQRNAAGLCGAAIQWGAIDNVGFVSQNFRVDSEKTASFMSISQYALQNVDDSLDCLHQWAQHRGVVTSFVPNDLTASHGEGSAGSNSAASAAANVVEDVQAKFASVLGGKAGDYDINTALQTYGLDSLSSTVLVNWTNQQLAHHQITAEFFDDQGMTINKMFAYIMEHKKRL